MSHFLKNLLTYTEGSVAKKKTLERHQERMVQALGMQKGEFSRRQTQAYQKQGLHYSHADGVLFQGYEHTHAQFPRRSWAMLGPHRTVNRWAR